MIDVHDKLRALAAIATKNSVFTYYTTSAIIIL